MASSSSSSTGDLDAALHDIEHHHAAAASRRLEEATRAKAAKEAAHRLHLSRFLDAQEEVAGRHLRQALALLGLFNAFFLLNVDSYTRDDLMSMVAVKLCAQVVRPGLELEAAAAKVLVHFFEGLHLQPALVRELQDLGERIVRSRRSGEWLLTDSEYRNYLKSKTPHKDAEPLARVAKQQTVAAMELQRVQAALQSLALLLTGPQEASDSTGGARRAAFFEGLLELANACARASLALNLEAAFEEGVLHAWSPRSHRSEALRALKAQQSRELQALRRQLTQLRAVRPEAAAAEETAYAAKRTEATFKELLFLRLRVLCVFQLQLVNVSAYNETGRAIKLAAWLAKPTLTPGDASLYLLLCLHAGLSSLGYGFGALDALLDLWAPASPKTRGAPALLVRNGAEIKAAKEAFGRMRRLLEHVGRRAATQAYAACVRLQETPFARLCADFLEAFPAPAHAGAAAEEAPPSACSTEHGEGDFEAVAAAVLQGHEHGQHAMRAEEAERRICAVTTWFQREEALAFAA